MRKITKKLRIVKATGGKKVDLNEVDPNRSKGRFGPGNKCGGLKKGKQYAAKQNLEFKKNLTQMRKDAVKQLGKKIRKGSMQALKLLFLYDPPGQTDAIVDLSDLPDLDLNHDLSTLTKLITNKMKNGEISPMQARTIKDVILGDQVAMEVESLRREVDTLKEELEAKGHKFG